MAAETFVTILTAGGKTNSLGRTNEVIERVLADQSRLEELYHCLSNQDAWVRMRAADALEKVCRQQPQWLEPYLDRMLSELLESTQPSIQWHLAQIFGEVALTPAQRQPVMAWLKQLLATTELDWIVAANAMATLDKLVDKGYFDQAELTPLLEIQLRHHSPTIAKRARKFIDKR